MIEDTRASEGRESETRTAETRSAAGEVRIDASAERVWRALTDARELERWFPLDARVEPGEGGRIWMSWRNEFDGEMKILTWDPPRLLRTAWAFHPADGPGQVTDYVIEAAGESTALRAVTSGFPLDPTWDGWVEGTERGWAFELRSLKHYLERHDGEPRHVAYVRRQVAVPAEAAWSRLESVEGLAPWMADGEVFDRRPGSQVAAVVADPPDSLFRVSVEPGAPGTEHREVVLFLTAWGDARARVEELRGEWAALLERAFPEGRDPATASGS